MINYLQASANISERNSENSVLNVNESAVMIVIKGYINALTDLYFPFNDSLHILQSLQARNSIMRGTIQSTWNLKTSSNCLAYNVKESTL